MQATRKELERYLKAMAMLDIIMLSKEKAWLRLISFSKNEKLYTYVVDNGGGDDLKVMFTENGVLMKGFDHENELNQFAADKWDNSFFEHIFAGLPEEFEKVLDEDDRDYTTFCMWSMGDTNIWTQNEIENNDGGKQFLLRYIRKTPEEWSAWAEEYYEVEVAREVVQKVYNQEKLTEEDVVKLNPNRDAKEVFAEFTESF